MGCVLCNLIKLSEEQEPFPSESARQDFMNELAGDIAQYHPELVAKIDECMGKATKRLPDMMENRDWAIDYVDKNWATANIDQRNVLLTALDDHLKWIKEDFDTKGRETKLTPSNCKLVKCSHNYIAPGENSQECIGCEGNEDPEWMPKR